MKKKKGGETVKAIHHTSQISGIIKTPPAVQNSEEYKEQNRKIED